MKTIKSILYALAIASLLIASSCASKPRGFVLPPALSETLRNGALAPLQQADSPILGMPNQNDRVAHVCRSQPIYTLEGYFVRTDVTCF